jgi:hypothetical protein
MTVGAHVAARGIDAPRASARQWGFIAGGSLLLSAVLQFIAASQRWLFADSDAVGSDRSVEDHLFDYTIPLDPWVSIGNAATLFGAGYLLIAGAIVGIGIGAHRRATQARAILPTAFVAAAPFAFFALHALVSGLLAVPSPLAGAFATTGALVFGVAQVVALLALAALIFRRSWAWSIGMLLLTGTSVFGYVIATFVVAPAIVGYQSYDTTPWTEGVLAAVTAASALFMFVGTPRSRGAR